MRKTTKLRSPCCNAPVYVADQGMTHWHECKACGQPCDPRDVTETETTSPGSLKPAGSALMACPFCGSPKVGVRFYNQPSVVCHNCLCMGPAASRLRKDNKDQCEREAIERWNQRHGNAASLLEFVEQIAKQQPEKPDYWSSCGQCDRNIDEARDLLPNAPGERRGEQPKV